MAIRYSKKLNNELKDEVIKFINDGIEILERDIKNILNCSTNTPFDFAHNVPYVFLLLITYGQSGPFCRNICIIL